MELLLRNKKTIFTILIFVIAFLIRLINLDKASGLWYDEMTIYSIASRDTFLEMIRSDINRFMVFPLYYTFYHCWIYLFGNADFTIRFMSAISDFISIILVFFITKETCKFIKLKEYYAPSLIAVIIYSLNAMLIYYSQEAKFYACTLMLSNLLVYSWLRYFNNSFKTRDFLFVYLASLILLYSYTSLLLLIVILYISAIVYIIKEKQFLNTLKHILLYPTMLIPLICIVYGVKGYMSGNFDAVVYDNTFIIQLFQSYFSPIIVSLQNNILNYDIFFKNNLNNPLIYVYIIIPIVIALCSLINALKKYPKLFYLFIMPVVFIGFHLGLTILTPYNVLVRYLLYPLPILLVICAIGLYSIHKSLLRTGLICYYTVVLIMALISTQSALYIERPDGYKTLAIILENNSVSKSSDFILPIRTNLLDKYYSIEGRKLSLYTLNSEKARETYLTVSERNGANSDFLNITNYYKRYLITPGYSKDFEQFVLNNYVPKNKNLVLITDLSICMFSYENVIEIANSETYNMYPLQFLRLSKLNKELAQVLQSHAKSYKILYHFPWLVYVFEY